MEKIAIVGTGIAGMGCAHFLHKHFDITLFEQNSYVGGHTNTIPDLLFLTVPLTQIWFGSSIS